MKQQMYPAERIGSSGSMFLKMYILVFSIIAKSSGLSTAHFMSQTSFLSNLLVETVVDEADAPRSSTNWSSPVTSIIDKQLE